MRVQILVKREMFETLGSSKCNTGQYKYLNSIYIYIQYTKIHPQIIKIKNIFDFIFDYVEH